MQPTLVKNYAQAVAVREEIDLWVKKRKVRAREIFVSEERKRELELERDDFIACLNYSNNFTECDINKKKNKKKKTFDIFFF